MSYRNAFKENLKTETIERNGKSRTYELSYEFEKIITSDGDTSETNKCEESKIKTCCKKIITSPTEMDNEDIICYIQKKYLNQLYIEKDMLINDLVIFKTYRDNLEIETENDKDFPILLSTFLTVYIAFLSMEIADKTIYLEEFFKLKEANKDTTAISNKLSKTSGNILAIISVILIISVIVVSFLSFRNGRKSKRNKLKTLNDAIYILEAIRDDIYNDPIKVSGTRKFDIEIDNVVDQASEPRKYSFKIDEILEEKINESTIEDKSKSIEIKINL